MTNLSGQRLPDELAELAKGRDLRLLLVRHAETEHNINHKIQGWSDSPITPRGREQIEQAAEALRPVAIDAVFASDLQRVRTTAEGILAVRDDGLEPIWRESLREWNFGGHEERDVSDVWGKLIQAHGLEVDRELSALRELQQRLTFSEMYDGIAELDETGESEFALDTVIRADESLAEIIDHLATIEATPVEIEPVPGVPPMAPHDVTGLVVSHGGFITTLLRQLVPDVAPTTILANCSITTVTLRDGVWSLEGVGVVPEAYVAR